MGRKYVLTKKAVEDLAEIWRYTYQTWSERQADKYYFLLLDVCQGLADGTVVARPYPEIHQKLSGARVGQHIIFYLSTDEAIEVIRILHSRMDLRSKMEGG